ncbi:MAG TPA: ankyrin repeat domain-containing protein [Blastocatellia bacterium]|nr:ankyrin repeat domain-containing protein [Blastocatellia bacterium]
MSRMEFVIGCLCLLLVLAAAPDVLAQTPAISPARVKARKELGQLGVEYSKSSFVKQASEGDTIAVQLFLAAGMDPNVYDEASGGNALMTAARGGHLETVSVLLAGGANPKGNTAVILATRLDVLKLLLDHGADVNIGRLGGHTALAAATGTGDVARLKLLLERGADVNAKDYNGRTVLMMAVEAAIFSRTQHNEESVRQLMDIVQMFLMSKADVNAKDKYGRTALLSAAGNGAVDMVRILLDQGADVNASDKDENTALTHAVRGGYTDLVKILLAKGADVNAGPATRTPLSLAAALNKTDIVQLLINAGAKQ